MSSAKPLLMANPRPVPPYWLCSGGIGLGEGVEDHLRLVRRNSDAVSITLIATKLGVPPGSSSTRRVTSLVQ